MRSKDKPKKKYPSELSGKCWKRLSGLLPKPKKKPNGAGRPPADLRHVVNSILYVLRGGISWRMLPNDYAAWQTAYGYFNEWSKAGVWEKVNTVLVKQVRSSTPKPEEKVPQEATHGRMN